MIKFEKLCDYKSTRLIEIVRSARRLRNSWMILTVQSIIFFSHYLHFWRDDHESENVAYISRGFFDETLQNQENTFAITEKILLI